MEQRDYAAAVAALNTLQSNFAIVDAIRASGGSLNQQALPEMREWCRRAGYKVCGGVGRGCNCMPTLYHTHTHTHTHDHDS